MKRSDEPGAATPFVSLSSLGWDERTDPPVEESAVGVQVVVSEAYEGIVLREERNHSAMVHCERPVDVTEWR